MSDVANSTNQIQFCLFASCGKISAPATRSLFTFPMNSTLNFPPLTGTHDATRKANLPGAVYLEVDYQGPVYKEMCDPGYGSCSRKRPRLCLQGDRVIMAADHVREKDQGSVYKEIG